MSCLFNTLSKFVDLDSNDLRENICNYMSNNPVVIDDIKINEFVKGATDDMEAYVKDMKKRSTWGGGIEIKLFCNMYNKAVIVENTQDGKYIEFLPKGKYSKDDVIQIKWNGGHYWV